MKETRIMLALQKKLACRQNSAKVKRLRKAIEVALANAEEKAASAEDKLDSLIQDFDVNTDPQHFLQQVSQAMYAKDENESAISQLKRINDYLFEELDVAAVPDEQK